MLRVRRFEAWVDRDRPFIENVLGAEWRVTDPSGRRLTRREVLDETLASDDRRIDSMVVDDLHVQMLSATAAVVTGRTRATGRYRGESATATLRFTDVFVFREGRWQAVASQGTFIPS